MTTIRPANVRIEVGTAPSRTLGEFVDEMRSFVRDHLADEGTWHGWVAEDVDRLVGCVWIQVVERVPIRTFVAVNGRSRM